MGSYLAHSPSSLYVSLKSRFFLQCCQQSNQSTNRPVKHTTFSGRRNQAWCCHWQEMLFLPGIKELYHCAERHKGKLWWRLFADTSLFKFPCSEDIGLANLQHYVCVALTVSMIFTNIAAKAVCTHIPQLNKMYRAVTTKPMKGFASQPKQQPLFTVSLIFYKLLGRGTLCLEPLQGHCGLETYRATE